MLRIYRDYAHDGDISYGECGSRNHLDIWRRPDLDRGGRAPVLLQVPGGAWMVGNKRGQAHPLMSHLAELGWVCVAINYRLSPRSTWPDQIVDVKRAIAWTKEHIAEYGGDPDWIAITGGSAGGHLSSLAALTPNDPRFQPGFEDADTRVQAAVPFYGVYDFTRTDDSMHPMMVPMVAKRVFKLRRAEIAEPFRVASPITHVSEDAPPFFVLHGTNDSLIPVEQARSFTARLTRGQPPARRLRRIALRAARFRHLRVGPRGARRGGRRAVSCRDICKASGSRLERIRLADRPNQRPTSQTRSKTRDADGEQDTADRGQQGGNLDAATRPDPVVQRHHRRARRLGRQ